MSPAESNPKRLDLWERNSHLSLPVTCLTVGKLFAFSNHLFKTHNGDISIYAWKRRGNSAGVLPALRAEASTSRNVLITFQRGDDAGGGTAPLKCHLFFLKTFCCSKNIKMTFYCRNNILKKTTILRGERLFFLSAVCGFWRVSVCVKVLKNGEL